VERILRHFGSDSEPEFAMSRAMHVPLALLGALAVGCAGDLATAPGDNPAGTTSLPGVSADATPATLHQQAMGGAVRIEVRFHADTAGTLVADKVEIEGPARVSGDEEIAGGVEGVDDSGPTLSLTLSPGGFEISTSDSTVFRDGNGTRISRADFRDLVDPAMAAEPLTIKAERPVPSEPQAPDDATFVARELRIVPADKGPKLELTVDADNIVLHDGGDPDAWLNVLGQSIELRTTDGITRMDDGNGDDDDHDAEREGLVASVSVDDGTFTLSDSTVLTMTDSSRIDDESDLRTLQDVGDALAAGHAVKAEAHVVATDSTLEVIEVAFEVEGDHDDDDGDDAGRLHFRGMAIAADSVAGTVTLADSAVVRVTDSTRIEDGDHHEHLGSVAEVEEALEAGDAIKVSGHGTPADDGSGELVASEIEFEVETPDSPGS